MTNHNLHGHEIACVVSISPAVIAQKAKDGARAAMRQADRMTPADVALRK